MEGFVIDTNLLIGIERENDNIKKYMDLLVHDYGGNIFITSPTLSEWFRGFIIKDKRKKGLSEIDKYYLLNTSRRSSLIFAELEYNLKKKGKLVSIFDLMIASICIAENITLITMDEDFTRIPGLNSVILFN